MLVCVRLRVRLRLRVRVRVRVWVEDAPARRGPILGSEGSYTAPSPR